MKYEKEVLEWAEKPPVKSYCGGKPNYVISDVQNVTSEVTGEVSCKTHPDAPHGFDRNASHSADRYVCECEGWEPVDGVDMSEERVHKSDKSRHEWVGLTEDDAIELLPVGDWEIESTLEFAKAIEAKLKEKNSPEGYA